MLFGINRMACVRSVYDFCMTVNHSNCSRDRSKLLLNHAQHTRRVINVLSVVYLIGFAMFAAFPMYDIIINRNYTLFLAVYIPNVDPHETVGFGIHVVMQLIMAVYAAAGNMTFDLLMAHVVLNYCTFVTVLHCQLQKLARLYETKETAKSVAHRNAFFRNLLYQFSDTNTWALLGTSISMHLLRKLVFLQSNRYVNSLNDMYQTTTAVQITSSSVSITISLFSIVAVTFLTFYFLKNIVNNVFTSQSITGFLAMVLYCSLWHRFSCYAGWALSSHLRCVHILIAFKKEYF